MMQKILLAINESPFSFQIAEFAYALAKPLEAELAILHVVDQALLPVFNEANPQQQEEVLLKLKEQSNNFLTKFQSQFVGLKNWIFSQSGIPAEEIIKAADEWKADLIIIGTHGRTGLKRLFMGSVAEDVLRHSKIPVVVIPSAAHGSSRNIY